MRSWTVLTVTAAPALVEAVESFLLDHGAPGLQTEETPAGVHVVAHFADAAPLAELDALLDALGDLFPDAPRPAVAVDSVAEQAWAENWKEHFPPLPIGERLYVHPPWTSAVPAERIGIVLDPGMAFGTGHHVSTRGCLVLLERALRGAPRARVLDLGTGSGILAIAAAKLGAAQVWAVDVDRDACAIAAENARLNGVGETIRVADELAAVAGRFDIVLANLLGGILIELAAPIAARVRPGGVAIGAGLQLEEAAAVRSAWRGVGLIDESELVDEGWVALAARRQA